LEKKKRITKFSKINVNYHFWKVIIKMFIESIDWDIWDAIVNNRYVPKIVVDNKTIEKPWSKWNESKKA